ncbi:hypothetical protein [Pseudomonas congelans]|uniref:hypothetical protein n=1 Tax=Pseudomonas congelans TaxID=200452 RepID=UPI0004E3AC41|nr:hypothetical protein [Pseudomonas congelans]KFE46492.1 hypothetical protein IV03_11405 [Pseudomonas congelans]
MAAYPQWLEKVIDQEVNDPIRNDCRTTDSTFLGWPRSTVFYEVIKGGQADFDAPQKKLTGADKALLYAKYNQGRHLDELRSAFDQLFKTSSLSNRPTVVDLGCGPFTAGLSLASVLGPEKMFRYYGVDLYESMRVLGNRMAEATKAQGVLHAQTRYQFTDDLSNIDFGAVRGELTIFVASYLLASPTLDPTELVVDILAAHKRIGPGPCAVLYTNSPSPKARDKFPAFSKNLIAGGFFSCGENVERFDLTRNPKDLHYALFFKRATD